MNQFQETFLVFFHSENKILVYVLSVWTKCVLKRILPSSEWWGHCLQLPCTKTSPWSNLSSDLSSNKENIQEDSDFFFAIMILITDNVCTLTFSDWVVTSSVTSLAESAIVSCICNLLIRFGCEITCNTCGRSAVLSLSATF